jgi:hypothetical protein
MIRAVDVADKAMGFTFELWNPEPVNGYVFLRRLL